MAKAFRYTFAAFCLTASVGCLALWVCGNEFTAGVDPGSWYATFSGSGGMGCTSIDYYDADLQGRTVLHVSLMNRPSEVWYKDEIVAKGIFGVGEYYFFFPLWYPALVSALAGVGILRVGRFTIRSAIIAMTVVAVLLGIVVAF